MKKDFIKFKPYTHLTPKTTYKDYHWVKNYVSDPQNITKHRFYPLLHYTIVENKFIRPRTNGVRATLRDHPPKIRTVS